MRQPTCCSQLNRACRTLPHQHYLTCYCWATPASCCPQSAEEFPLKLGAWRRLGKLTAKAVREARSRKPCEAGSKPKPRKRTALIGLPDLPSRPELERASALIYAVRRCGHWQGPALSILSVKALIDAGNIQFHKATPALHAAGPFVIQALQCSHCLSLAGAAGQGELCAGAAGLWHPCSAGEVLQNTSLGYPGICTPVSLQSTCSSALSLITCIPV
jgi:hypothetical protein